MRPDPPRSEHLHLPARCRSQSSSQRRRKWTKQLPSCWGWPSPCSAQRVRCRPRREPEVRPGLPERRTGQGRGRRHDKGVVTVVDEGRGTGPPSRWPETAVPPAVTVSVLRGTGSVTLPQEAARNPPPLFFGDNKCWARSRRLAQPRPFAARLGFRSPFACLRFALQPSPLGYVGGPRAQKAT